METTFKPADDLSVMTTATRLATLIQIQDAALAKLNVTRSSEKRYMKLRGSVYRWYIAQVAKIGITGKTASGHSIADATWRDVWDMKLLNDAAED